MPLIPAIPAEPARYRGAHARAADAQRPDGRASAPRESGRAAVYVQVPAHRVDPLTLPAHTARSQQKKMTWHTHLWARLLLWARLQT